MVALQKFTGVVFVLGGIVMGLATLNLAVFALGVTAGCVLISLSVLIRLATDLSDERLGLPISESRLRTLIRRSPQYDVESGWLNVYPDQEASYPLIMLDGEPYIRARAFYRYLSQEEARYTFRLPNREPVELDCSDRYHKGTDLFEYEDQVFVRLAALNLPYRIGGTRLVIG